MHKRAEHLTVLTDIFSPDTAADGLEICPILPSPSFLSRQKSVPLKLRAPKTDYFCRDSLRTTRECREYFKEDETEYRQKEPLSASGVGSLMHKKLLPYLCKTDHCLASVMHTRLIRTQTEALGGDFCDYWYVGDKSPVLENYRDLEEI